MPKPTSDHDIEASSWSWHRGPVLDTAAETFYILIKRRDLLLITTPSPASDHDTAKCLAAISPSRHGGLILTMMIGTEACHDVIETAA